jgi:hypothetical protein
MIVFVVIMHVIINSKQEKKQKQSSSKQASRSRGGNKMMGRLPAYTHLGRRPVVSMTVLHALLVHYSFVKG